MPHNPTVEPLPRSHRRAVFWTFLIVFVVAMPSLWFYTTGYRFDWANEDGSIVGVGGLYISTDAQSVEFFVDDEQVTDFRIFRKAAYIQNLIEGTHAIHVQGSGLQTWTKDLPVQSYIVTEAFAFMMPAHPRVRVIGEYETATGTAVLRMPAAGAPAFFSFASTTNAYIGTTTRATSTLIQNPEHQYVKNLFASSTATTTSLVQELSERIERQFVPRAATSTADARATTTRLVDDMRIYEAAGEVQVSWMGTPDERPNYFCVPSLSSSSTPTQYGAHVYADILEEGVLYGVASTTEDVARAQSGQRVCRDSIRIDRKGKGIRMFDFFPGNPGLVLMLLEDGLYVVEVDDRAWQNTQLLYPGSDLLFVVDGGRIYVRDREQYIEVFTTSEGS